MIRRPAASTTAESARNRGVSPPASRPDPLGAIRRPQPCAPIGDTEKSKPSSSRSSPQATFQLLRSRSARAASRSESPSRAWSTVTEATTSAGIDGRPRRDRRRSATLRPGAVDSYHSTVLRRSSGGHDRLPPTLNIRRSSQTEGAPTSRRTSDFGGSKLRRSAMSSGPCPRITPVPDPDGERIREDTYCSQPLLSAHQAWRCRADSVPR